VEKDKTRIAFIYATMSIAKILIFIQLCRKVILS